MKKTMLIKWILGGLLFLTLIGFCLFQTSRYTAIAQAVHNGTAFPEELSSFNWFSPIEYFQFLGSMVGISSSAYPSKGSWLADILNFFGWSNAGQTASGADSSMQGNNHAGAAGAGTAGAGAAGAGTTGAGVGGDQAGSGANGPGGVNNNSGGNGPDGNGPDGNGPGGNGPGGNGPGGNGPGYNGPGDNGPGDNGPGDNGPGDNGPGDNGPGGNGPGGNGPGGNGPGGNGPGGNSGGSGPSGNHSGNNSGGYNGYMCVPGCYPGCIPGCDPTCNAPCLLGPVNPSTLPVTNPSPSNSSVAQIVNQKDTEIELLATLLAAKQALATQATEMSQGNKDINSITPVDTTPAPQDVVDQIKSGQLIQH